MELDIIHVLPFVSAWGRTVDFEGLIFVYTTMKSSFIIYTPLTIVSSPKEITQRQALVNTVVKVS